MQIQICWLQKPTDLDLHCLQSRIYPGSAWQGLIPLLNGLQEIIEKTGSWWESKNKYVTARKLNKLQ